MKNILFLIFLICQAASANAETVTVDGVRYFTNNDVNAEDTLINGEYHPYAQCSDTKSYVKLRNINCAWILITKTGCSTNCLYCSPLDKNKCVSCYYSTQTMFIFGSSTICLNTGTCLENATCSGTTITCNSGYTELNGACVAKAVDDTPLLCQAGYTNVNGTCVKDEAKNTVNSCPPEMTLSADGCCCLN